MRASYRILARDQRVCNDTWVSGLNNNDLIIGPSGAGKTRGYVKPNLLSCQDESVIVADPKGSLLQEVGPLMALRGYEIQSIDFTQMGGSHGYDPLDFVRRGSRPGEYNQQDVLTIARAICPVRSWGDPYWDNAAAQLLSILICYVLEAKPRKEQNMSSVSKAFEWMDYQPPDEKYPFLVRELAALGNESFALRRYNQFSQVKVADRTYASIFAILSQRLELFTLDTVRYLCAKPRRVNFARMGRKKTALFLTVSDTDRSADSLVDLLYLQAFQSLFREADRNTADHRLRVPVRFILDDFTCNAVIPDFDNIISVIRSREISVSIIIQSLSQLEGLYGRARAMTIVNNCDHCLYLGGQDVETARYFSIKMNRTMDSILNLPLDHAYLFTRGERPKKVEKFNLRQFEQERPSMPAPGEQVKGQKEQPAKRKEEARPPAPFEKGLAV